jgi:hypothetical protein
MGVGAVHLIADPAERVDQIPPTVPPRIRPAPVAPPYRPLSSRIAWGKVAMVGAAGTVVLKLSGTRSPTARRLGTVSAVVTLAATLAELTEQARLA